MNEHKVLAEVLWGMNVLGEVAFAISGASVAMSKRFDPFGVFIIAFVTAVGGGTLRDLLLDIPVFWLQDTLHIYIVAATAFLLMIFQRILRLQRMLVIFDAIGLGVFAIVGTSIGYEMGMPWSSSMGLGVSTACFGGVIRDILANEEPLVFKQEIYATAAILGSLSYLLLCQTNIPILIAQFISIAIVVCIRLVAVRYHIHLPMIYKKDVNTNS